MSQRTQRKAALQASQQLAWDAAHDGSAGPVSHARQSLAEFSDQRQKAGKDDDRRTTALEEWRIRRVKRQLVDLERTNAHDLPSTAFPVSSRTDDSTQLSSALNNRGIVPQSIDRLQRRREDKRRRGIMTANVKTLVQYRKTLREYLNELPSDTPYVTSVAPAPNYPPRHPCASCSHPDGKYPCERCGEHSCSTTCWRTHRDLGIAEGGCGVGQQGMVGLS
ncbi:hypothetical protein NliqN6_2764 [Naganishia liquefaciens]|uniref:HIT-type domain-containing protein n=1 Tax=Naganishia liquefaciens TaxID=104408 RepID=A0A8H3TSH6_9TREE|nr:hypothetical protein NliqN6_2764 [Naganishia liquefaciens]